MNRRSFIRVFTGGVSAVVFTSAGWLMGTRSLGMGGNCPPGEFCNVYCHDWYDCVRDTSCGGDSQCRFVTYSGFACTFAECAVYCAITSVREACGTCPSC